MNRLAIMLVAILASVLSSLTPAAHAAGPTSQTFQVTLYQGSSFYVNDVLNPSSSYVGPTSDVPGYGTVDTVVTDAWCGGPDVPVTARSNTDQATGCNVLYVDGQRHLWLNLTRTAVSSQVSFTLETDGNTWVDTIDITVIPLQALSVKRAHKHFVIKNPNLKSVLGDNQVVFEMWNELKDTQYSTVYQLGPKHLVKAGAERQFIKIPSRWAKLPHRYVSYWVYVTKHGNPDPADGTVSPITLNYKAIGGGKGGDIGKPPFPSGGGVLTLVG